jgi:phage tail tape-measure protein
MVTVMNTSATIKRELGKVASALDENISDAEMDQLLENRNDEIEALLEEARQAISRGEVAPLEPLHVFLRRARERYKADR